MSALPSTPHPRLLPLPLTPMIGRDYEMLELTDLLRDPDVRLVTVIGPGGVGKTRLAMQLAQRLAGAFADGLCFVPLDPIQDAALLVPMIAQSAGILDTGSAPVFDELVAGIGDGQFLIVLDNMEHLMDGVPHVISLMTACPGLTILATSRAPLEIYGEREYPLEPLPLPARDRTDAGLARSWADYPSLRLFVDRATEVQPGFRVTSENIVPIAEICQRLDGLPLAIELAAVRLKVLTPQLLLQHLGRRLQVLTGGSRGRAPRFQTMRDTIDWSYELLTPDQQRLFRRLGVFSGGFSPEMALVVCTEAASALGEHGDGVSDDPLTFLDGIGELVDQSLVMNVGRTLPEPRFDMLQTIQEFARERLAECDELAPLQRAHAAFMADVVERAEAGLTGANPSEASNQLETEHDNIRAALGWATSHGDAHMAHRLAAPLWRFWWNRGHVNEGRTWLDQVMALDGSLETRDRARVLYGAGQLADIQGDYEQAVQFDEDGLAIARKVNDAFLVAWFLNALGCISHDRGRYEDALRFHSEAQARFEEAGDRRGLAGSLHNLGNLFNYQGEYEQAEGLYLKALDLLREVGDPTGVGVCLGNLGTIAFSTGKYARARELQEECLELTRSVGDQIGVAIALTNLGSIALAEGDADEAVRLHESALSICEAAGARRSAAIIRLGLGQITRELGDYPASATALTAALEVCRELDDLESTADAIWGLGAIAGELGDVRRALRLLSTADRLCRSIGAGLEAGERERHDRDIARLRRVMSETEFATGWEAGDSTPLETIVAEAMEVAAMTRTAHIDAAARDVMERFGLYPREVEVLRQFAAGRSTQEMAEELAVSTSTVTQYVGQLYTKLDVDSRAGLAAIAFKHGLV